MKQRICKVCKEVKCISKFDGSRKTCKECMKIWRKKYNKRNKEKIADYYKIHHAQHREEDNTRNRDWIKNNPERLKKYRSQTHIKKIMNDACKKWYENNREKRLTYFKVQYALRSGRIQKQSCEVCGNPKADAHHDDYTKPLQIRWLCRRHHKEYHRKIKETMLVGV